MSWASERRFSYALGTVLFLLLVVGGSLFVLYYEPPTCFDSRQNGEELGIDCGGNCERLCAMEVQPLKVLWSRVFEVSPGKYNAVAYVENPNRNAGIRDIPYVFKVLSQTGALLSERNGSTFITPNGISAVFESDIQTEGHVPSRTFFEFTSDPLWHRAQSLGQTLAVKGTQLLDTTTRPRINATLINNSLEEYQDVEVVGVVFAADGNAVAASRTVVNVLPKQGSVPIVFTWPRPFEKRLEQCVVPADVMLLIDISGSMNDLGGNPPQPISDTKSAAKSFVSRLQEDDRAGVVTFATNASLSRELTLSHANIAAFIESLSVPASEEGGRTNISDALKLGVEALLSASREEKHSKVMVLITDGKANAPTERTAETAALDRALSAKLNEVVTYTIGLGANINEGFLTEVATSPSHYFKAATSKDLESVYQEISTAICERGPAVIDIVPRVKSSLFLEPK